MKVFFALGAALFLFGCAPSQTLEELEAQAAITGDWSAVEKRERIMARRDARRPPSCPAGTMSYCESSIGQLRCACVDKSTMRAAIGQR
ncbi:MAG: hypothetical protein QNJ00_06735 [Woeseiaceae bacterium]|nr:hypothetical protein [Woeseiaceae bacterium]